MNDIDKIKTLYQSDHCLPVRIAADDEYPSICDTILFAKMIQIDRIYYKVVEIVCEKEVVLKIKENYEKSETK